MTLNIDKWYILHIITEITHTIACVYMASMLLCNAHVCINKSAFRFLGPIPANMSMHVVLYTWGSPPASYIFFELQKFKYTVNNKQIKFYFIKFTFISWCLLIITKVLQRRCLLQILTLILQISDSKAPVGDHLTKGDFKYSTFVTTRSSFNYL